MYVRHPFVFDQSAAQETELSPGVSASRRCLLKSGLALFALGYMTPAFGRDATKSLDFSEFETRLNEAGDALKVRGFEDEEQYIKDAAAIMHALDLSTLPAPQFRKSPILRGSEFGLLFNASVYAELIRMEPNAVLPLHDHRDYNGVLMGVRGSCRTECFNIESNPGNFVPGSAVNLKKTADLNVTAGVSASLTTQKDNVHEIVAGPDGMLFLDVFAFKNAEAGSYALELDRNQDVDSGRVVRAYWGEGL